MNDQNKFVRLDADEFSVAEAQAEASKSVYVHKFRQPFEYEGMKITELKIDFEKLTGRDGLAIENELQRAGKVVIAPAFSGEYLIRMAARVTDPKIGADAFELMSLSDYNKIRSEARSFLLKSESQSETAVPGFDGSISSWRKTTTRRLTSGCRLRSRSSRHGFARVTIWWKRGKDIGNRPFPWRGRPSCFMGRWKKWRKSQT